MAKAAVIPILLGFWLSFLTLVTLMLPEHTLLLLGASVAIAVAIAAFVFPGAALIIGIASTALTVENFLFFHEFNHQYPTFLASSSFHKIVSIALMIPAILRYGLKPAPNPVIGAFLLMFAATFLFAKRLPSLDDAQVIQTLVGLSLPYVVFNMRLQGRWVDNHLAILAFVPIISVVLGMIAELAELRAWYGLPWKLFSQEHGTGAYRLSGINIAAGLAANAYIAFYICIFQAVLYQKKGYYVLAGILVIITVLSGTRGPLAAEIIFAGLGILIASNQDLRASAKLNFGIIGAVVLGVILVAYWPNLEARFAPSGDSDEVINTSARSHIWELEYAAFEESPVFGRGLGAGAVFLLDNEWENLAAARATHNEFLRLLLDGGIVGLSAYILGLILLMSRECRGVNKSTGRLTFAMFLSFAFYSFTDNTISSSTTLNVFYALALLLLQARLANRAWAPAAAIRRPAYA